MSDSLARWLNKPDVPIDDFLVSLPIDVCIKRLYGTRIKDVYTTVELKTKPVDANSYDYELGVTDHYTPIKGRTTNASSFLYELEMIDHPKRKSSVVGTLEWKDEQTTRVIIMHKSTPSDLVIWERMVVVVWFMFIGAALTSGPLCVMFSIIIVMWMWGGSNREAVRLIQESLMGSSTDDIPKNEA